MKHKWDILWRVVWWACAGLWAVALCVVVHYARRALVADVFVVPSESMQPTLLPGDRVKVELSEGRGYYVVIKKIIKTSDDSEDQLRKY